MAGRTLWVAIMALNTARAMAALVALVLSCCRSTPQRTSRKRSHNTSDMVCITDNPLHLIIYPAAVLQGHHL
jgi:phage terminase large subunit-like protein